MLHIVQQMLFVTDVTKMMKIVLTFQLHIWRHPMQLSWGRKVLLHWKQGMKRNSGPVGIQLRKVNPGSSSIVLLFPCAKMARSRPFCIQWFCIQETCCKKVKYFETCSVVFLKTKQNFHAKYKLISKTGWVGLYDLFWWTFYFGGRHVTISSWLKSTSPVRII